MKGSNKTTVLSTTIGGALAVIFLIVLTKAFGVVFSTAESSSLVVALTTAFNYFVPEDFQKSYFKKGE